MTTTHEASNVEATRSMTNKEMIAAIVLLQTQVADLTKKLESATTARNEASREMTDDDARRILNGNLKDAKHKDAAQQLGLSYGQIYSCRLGYTFKGIHKELNEAGFKNPWIKA